VEDGRELGELGHRRVLWLSQTTRIVDAFDFGVTSSASLQTLVLLAGLGGLLGHIITDDDMRGMSLQRWSLGLSTLHRACLFRKYTHICHRR